MGLFAWLTRSDRDTENEEEQISIPKLFPMLIRGMQVNVFHPDGKLFITGKLTAFTESGVKLERVPGQLSFETAGVGSEVHMRGFTSTGAPFDIRCSVQESSRVLCKLQDLKEVPHEELRGNFRLPLNTAISLYYPEDMRLQNPEEAKLVNISVGGACIQSEYVHGEGEVLRMKVKIEDYAPMTFLGEIIRVEEPLQGQFRYGFLFAQLGEKETETLTKLLFNIQVGNTSAWTRNPESGIWE